MEFDESDKPSNTHTHTHTHAQKHTQTDLNFINILAESTRVYGYTFN